MTTTNNRCATCKFAVPSNRKGFRKCTNPIAPQFNQYVKGIWNGGNCHS